MTSRAILAFSPTWFIAQTRAADIARGRLIRSRLMEVVVKRRVASAAQALEHLRQEPEDADGDGHIANVK